MNSPADPLAQLRDVHLPPEPSLWPPAVGWWLVLGLIMIVAWLGVSLLRRWQRNAMYRQAQSQLDKVQQEIEQHGLSSKTIVTLSKLARQIAISCYDRQTVAGISGQAWLEFLDKTGDTKAFTTGIGRTLRDAPYCNSQPPAEAKALPMLLKQWMHKQKKTRANRVLPNLRTRS